MKFTFSFLLILLTITACNPSFHRQKHTNFGHVKALKLKEGNIAIAELSEVDPNSNNEALKLVAENVNKPAIVSDSSVLQAEDILFSAGKVFPDTLLIQPKDSLKTSVLTTADSLSSEHYVWQLKREAKRNFFIGMAEIAVGVLAFLFLPYWMPVLVIHCVAGVILLLIASHKASKANTLIEEPGKYKNPAGKHKFSLTLMHLSNVGYVLLLLGLMLSAGLIATALTATLVYVILALVVLYIICVPLVMIALVLLLIAGIKGRNYTREENLQWVDTDSGPSVRWYNAINWSIIAVAFTGAVVWFSKVFSEE